VTGGVLRVLSEYPHTAPCRLAHQHRQVEAGEQTRRKRVGARGHVDHDVLAGPVDQVVEVELHRAGLRVVAGYPDVGLVELAGHQVPHTTRCGRVRPQQLARRVEIEQP
jgi:hypothetical protein